MTHEAVQAANGHRIEEEVGAIKPRLGDLLLRPACPGALQERVVGQDAVEVQEEEGKHQNTC
jgi:hypothetical protein